MPCVEPSACPLINHHVRGTQFSLIGVCEFSFYISLSEFKQDMGQDADGPELLDPQRHVHVELAARFQERNAVCDTVWASGHGRRVLSFLGWDFASCLSTGCVEE